VTISEDPETLVAVMRLGWAMVELANSCSPIAASTGGCTNTDSRELALEGLSFRWLHWASHIEQWVDRIDHSDFTQLDEQTVCDLDERLRSSLVSMSMILSSGYEIGRGLALLFWGASGTSEGLEVARSGWVRLPMAAQRTELARLLSFIWPRLCPDKATGPTRDHASRSAVPERY